MPQIAQQDHLYFEIGHINELTKEEKAGLLKKVENGTILDTVLVSDTDFIPIIFASRTGYIAFYNNAKQAITMIDLEEQE